MNDLRALFPHWIGDGVLLRPDGVAVGLVGGGAPAWELLGQSDRAATLAAYHRLLCALDAPLDVYVVDQPVTLGTTIGEMLERRSQVAHTVHAQLLTELADALLDLEAEGLCRARRVIWAVTAAPSAARGTEELGHLRSLLGSVGKREPSPPRPAAAQQARISQALARARQLADALRQLGGTPPPRLLSAEEIARLLYQLADPVRAYRAPLAGTLLDRVRRVVTTADQEDRHVPA